MKTFPKICKSSLELQPRTINEENRRRKMKKKKKRCTRGRSRENGEKEEKKCRESKRGWGGSGLSPTPTTSSFSSSQITLHYTLTHHLNIHAPFGHFSSPKHFFSVYLI